jgi:hypothetical protein
MILNKWIEFLIETATGSAYSGMKNLKIQSFLMKMIDKLSVLLSIK